MKKKHMLIRDFFREVKNSRNRFLSILVIIVLGVAFFAGIRASGPDMELSADIYYDSVNLMDIRVLGTMGLTDEDVRELEKIKGVRAVSPSCSSDVLCSIDEAQPVIHLMALTPGINQLTVKEGRLPEKADEIFLDEKLMDSYGYQIGDTVSLFSGDEERSTEEILAVTDYTIVGMGASPFYLSLDRGTSSIGDGSVSGFGVIPMESFSMDVYTEIYLSVEGAEEDLCYGDTYKDTVKLVKERLEEISGDRCEVRYASVRADGQEDLEKARQEIDDARKKLKEAEAELQDGEQKLTEGKEELQEKENELTEGRERLEEETKTYTDGKKQLEAAEKELEKQALVLSQKRIQLQNGKGELREKEQELISGKQQLADAKKKLEEARIQLESRKDQVELGRQQLPVLKAALERASETLETYKAEEDSLNQELGSLQAEYEEALKNPEENKEKIALLELAIAEKNNRLNTLQSQISFADGLLQLLAAGVAEAEKGIQEYDAGWEKVLAGEAALPGEEEKLQQGEEQLEAAKTVIADGEIQLASGEKKLREAETLLLEKKNQLSLGKVELDDAWKKIRDGEEQIAEAKVTLEENEQELEDARETFEQESKDAEEEIRNGEEKISDGEKKVNELEIPVWYVLGRDSLQTYVEYGQDAQRIQAIGKVFPVIFFLVAALICLNTMTRMVEENRTQIGTLKALGYGKGAIAAKYLFYAFFASVIGSVIGFWGGQAMLPVIIIKAYAILYNNLTVIRAPIYTKYAVSSTAVAVGITVFAAGFSCWRELEDVPAQLMRPEAPKSGKRILLEHIPVIWNHMSFSKKAAARNLFRYKKRFFMTILGIGGCMGLLMVGFGLNDSIMAIGEKQFGEIRTYSSSVVLDTGITDAERKKVLDMIKQDDDVIKYMEAYESSVDIGYEDMEKSSYLVVASDIEKFKEFVTLKDRMTKEVYELSDEGVIITEKLAKLLNVNAGDMIYLKDSDNRRMDVCVTAVTENYFFHYVYMTPAVYERLYREPPEYSEILTVNKEETPEFEDAFRSRYTAAGGVQNVAFLSSVSDRIADMLKSMDSVIYIIVIAAGMLAFVVLYNLNNINISERRRELATLKVLGFYEQEVSMYVFRENVVLTVIGSMVGVVFGLILHRFVILTAEIDLMMFGRNIKLMSFIWSICLTFLFSFLVNLFMHFKLRKLDMVESMKSVE